jgi:tetratricopeptide (TPR) repeat protein
VFALYDSVARAISGALAVRFQSASSPSGAPRQVNPDAYQAYLQGKTYLANRVVDSAITFLTKAVRLDSSYADAWASLGSAFAIAGPSDYLILSADSAIAGAGRAVARAVALDTTSAEVWNAVGGLAQKQFRWDDALKAYDRALQINPGHVPALQVSAIVLAGLDRVPEGMARIRRAQEIDPLSFIVSDWAMVITWLTGDHENALAQGERLIALNPRNERIYRDVALLHARARKWDRAADLYAARHLMLGGDSATANRIRTGLVNPATRAATAHVVESTGRVQWRAADMLLAAGDSAGAINSLRTIVVRPGAFPTTLKSWVAEPGITNSSEFKRLVSAARMSGR